MAGIPGLTGSLIDILDELLSEGFEPPLLVSGISLNGTTVNARYDLSGSRWAGAFIFETLQLPINITFFDFRGETARAVWTEDGVSLIEVD